MPTPAEVMINALRELVQVQQQTLTEIRCLRGDARIERRRAAGPVVATDEELDGTHGDPMVRFTPRGFAEVTQGRRMSELSPEALRVLARVFDSFADRADAEGTVDNKGRPKSVWEAANARLARGWAKRKLSTPQPPPGAGDSWEAPDEAPPAADDAAEKGWDD
jgi:hypothetical protein